LGSIPASRTKHNFATLRGGVSIPAVLPVAVAIRRHNNLDRVAPQISSDCIAL
jgi:hypothetical protein